MSAEGPPWTRASSQVRTGTLATADNKMVARRDGDGWTTRRRSIMDGVYEGEGIGSRRAVGKEKGGVTDEVGTAGG